MDKSNDEYSIDIESVLSPKADFKMSRSATNNEI